MRIEICEQRRFNIHKLQALRFLPKAQIFFNSKLAFTYEGKKRYLFKSIVAKIEYI